MAVGEMIPDTTNCAHDPRFWCLPPMHETEGGQQDGQYPLYLVTQGTVVKAMVDGFPVGAQCGHHSVCACIEEWQVHCRLGVHPHPVEPLGAQTSSPPLSPPPSLPLPPMSVHMSAVPSPFLRQNACPVAAELQADLFRNTYSATVVATCDSKAGKPLPINAPHDARPKTRYSPHFHNAAVDTASMVKPFFGAPRIAHANTSSNASSTYLSTAAARTDTNTSRLDKGTCEVKAKPGKKSWVHGTKLLFFERRKDKWIAAVEASQPGLFYTKMAHLFILKYGHSIKDSEDLVEDIEDPPDLEADNVVNEVLTPEEARSRSKQFKALCDRIAAWYRLKYGSMVKSDKEAFADLFTRVLDGAPAKPRVAARTGDKKPELLAVRAVVTKEIWDEETPGFQGEVLVALEREHQTAMTAWKASLVDSPTKTAEEMAA
ncbi:hypothetical protein C8R44DRAFT_887810 [Mycena epipterygia]|nr:hypothetical protein C8R44DRAFT_887810 [Mycena epipterygia]